MQGDGEKMKIQRNSKRDRGRERQSRLLHKHQRDSALNQGHKHQEEGTQRQKNFWEVK